MVAAAAATSVLSLCGSPALADSQADGAAANSPGAVSGNAVQAPVEVPVNVCGNTVDVIAALNPVFGNSCASDTDDEQHGGYGHDQGGYGDDASSVSAGPSDGSSAHSQSVGSPGVASGNDAQIPVDVPLNLCGNTIDVIGIANPAFGNECEEEDGGTPPGYGDETPPEEPPTDEHPPPPGEHTPPPGTDTPPPAGEEEPPSAGEEELPPAGEEQVSPPAEQPPVLAETGSHGDALAGASAASAALIVGGAVLYRRSRATARR
nr:chaplin [Streptomyces sp. CRN 30]